MVCDPPSKCHDPVFQVCLTDNSCAQDYPQDPLRIRFVSFFWNEPIWLEQIRVTNSETFDVRIRVKSKFCWCKHKHHEKFAEYFEKSSKLTENASWECFKRRIHLRRSGKVSVWYILMQFDSWFSNLLPIFEYLRELIGKSWHIAIRWSVYISAKNNERTKPKPKTYGMNEMNVSQSL